MFSKYLGQGELYAHKFCAVDIFWNITRRQAISPVPSRVLAWFDDLSGDIDFYQMSLSESESTTILLKV